jgi:probable phosphoglycerate mutase
VPQPSLLVSELGGTELLLIRHGRSADVVPGAAESSDPELNEEGRRQAEVLASRLEPERKRIDAVYASDLRRASATARALAEPRSLKVHIRPALREVHLGDWERGEFRRRAAVRDPEWLAFAETGRWDNVPGSEGDDALRRRVGDCIEAIVAAHPDQIVAVVAHGGVINAYLAEITGNRRSFFAAIENTSVTLVRARRDLRTIVLVNDCSHLYDAVIGPPVG